MTLERRAREIEHRWGRSIRAGRERLGWTHRELAYKVGTSYGTVQRWEAGQRPMTWQQLRLAEVFEVPVEDLFSWEEP